MGQPVLSDQKRFQLALLASEKGCTSEAIIHLRQVILNSKNQLNVELAQRQIYLLTSSRSTEKSE